MVRAGASSGSAFGSSFGTSAFGGGQQQQQQQQRVGSRVTPYAVTNDTDAGVGAQAGKFLCISAMPSYKDKQLEELRWEDYRAGDKGEHWSRYSFRMAGLRISS